MTPRRSGTAPVRPALLLVGLLVLAANLRVALSAYPPLLETVRQSLGVSAGVAGLVQACAVGMMGVASFLSPWVGRRFGWERALGGSVGLASVGCVVRVVPALPALIFGSALVGLGIGGAGVLMAGVVKHHLAARAGTVTGGYVVSMMVGGGITGVVAVPLAVGLGGWSFSLAAWAVPAALATALWWPVARRLHGGTAMSSPGGVARASSGDVDHRSPGDVVGCVAGGADRRPAGGSVRRSLEDAGRTDRSDRSPGGLPWRQRFAWLTTLYLAMSSVQYYGWLTWLAPYYEHLGWSTQHAAVLQATWMVAQIPVTLGVAMLVERHGNWVLWAASTLVCGIVGILGALLWPIPPVFGPWLWVVLNAVGAATGFALGLTVVSWRTPNAAAAGATSGMALGIGYLLAGAAPTLMGLLLDATGGYRVPFAVLVVAGVLQLVATALIGNRPRPRAGGLAVDSARAPTVAPPAS